MVRNLRDQVMKTNDVQLICGRGGCHRSGQAMLDANAAGLHKEAGNTTIKHGIVVARLQHKGSKQ